MRSALGVVMLAACYAPSPPAGSPCSAAAAITMTQLREGSHWVFWVTSP